MGILGQVNYALVAQAKGDIAATKASLIRKAERRGIWENFGQREAREIQDKYPGLFFEIGGAINDFLEWAEAYQVPAK